MISILFSIASNLSLTYTHQISTPCRFYKEWRNKSTRKRMLLYGSSNANCLLLPLCNIQSLIRLTVAHRYDYYNIEWKLTVLPEIRDKSKYIDLIVYKKSNLYFVLHCKALQLLDLMRAVIILMKLILTSNIEGPYPGQSGHCFL